MTSRRTFAPAMLGGIAALALAACAAEPADPPPPAASTTGTVEVGTLTCKLRDVTNVIVYTNEVFTCLYEGSDGTNDLYEGVIDSVGLNLEIKADETLVWTVIAPATIDAPGVLAGEYIGVSAGASVGTGLSANALVGGSEDQFALQPLAASVTSGIGATLTIDNFTLTDIPS